MNRITSSFKSVNDENIYYFNAEFVTAEIIQNALNKLGYLEDMQESHNLSPTGLCSRCKYENTVEECNHCGRAYSDCYEV